MKKYLLLIASLCAAMIAFTSCKDDSVPGDESEIENGEGNSNTNENGQTVNLPDCFVYYKGANFIFKRTLDDGRTTKVTWDVTAYDSSSSTATVSVKSGDDDPYEIKIRKNSKGIIEFNRYGSWKALTDGGKEINFLMGSELNTIPSGCYGSIKNTTKLESVTTPGGKSSQGFSIGSEYTYTSGFHDSFMFDYSSGETWCSECGLTQAGYAYRNGKETPIYVNTWTLELIAYDIPMPDGSRRSYKPSGSTVYDVTTTNFSCYQNDYKTQRYACIFGYWNDKKNTNVLRYQLCILWYEDGWTYGHITDDMHSRWSLSAWFAGKPYSGKAIGGSYDGVQFDCEGLYSSSTGSQSYSPFDMAGYFTFFVLAENMIAVGEPDTEETVFGLLYIPNDGSYASTYSVRVEPGDDGYVYEYGTKATKSTAGIRTGVPDPSWISGPIRKLKTP